MPVSVTASMKKPENWVIVQWCGFWFGSNLAITFLNKFVLSGKSTNVSASANTYFHLALTFIGSLLFNKFAFPSLTRKELFQLFIFAGVFSFNIVYSQYGMKLTNLSLNQVIRATTPFFQVILETMFQLQDHHCVTLQPLIPVVIGVAIASYGDLEVTFWSFAVSLSSAFVSAFKGVLSMKILQKDLRQRVKEFSFLIIVAPMAFLWILLFELFVSNMKPGGIIWYITRIVFSDTDDTSNDSESINNENSIFSLIHNIESRVLMYLLIGGILAFATNVASFGTVKRTSATTMGVMANIKQAVVIFVAMLFQEHSWTLLKFVGILITIIGGAWYSYEKEKEKSRKDSMSAESSRATSQEIQSLTNNNHDSDV